MEDMMTVPGYSWDEGGKLTKLEQKTDKNDGSKMDVWTPIVPWNLIPTRVLREGHDIKVVEGTVVFVNGRTKDVSLPASIISANRPALELLKATGLDLSHKEATELAGFIEVIVTEQAHGIPEVEVLTDAEWRGDELRVPGFFEVSPRKPFAELAKYGETRGDEEEAREAWHDALKMASRYPKMLLALGMPIGSLYAARLRRAPFSMGTATFALHLTGDSARGKTQLAISAMMTVGDATEKSTKANLYRTWDMSAQAPVALAHQLGILPLYFDEAATSQKTPEEFTQQLFALAQGTERQRATVTGDVDEVDRWESCILSTGEMRITSKSGLVGVRRRVQELYAPFADQYVSDHVLTASSEHFGWPLRWIAARPDINVAASLFDQIHHTFDDPVSWLNAAALNLSICGLGALMIARAVKLDLTAAEVNAAVQDVVLKAGRAAIEEGVDAGAKLLKAIRDAVAQRPNAFPGESTPVPLTREREGVLFSDGSIGIVSRAALLKIARDAGLPDFQAGLRILQQRGLMRTEQNRDQVMETLSIADGQTIRKRIYVFLRPEERDL